MKSTTLSMHRPLAALVTAAAALLAALLPLSALSHDGRGGRSDVSHRHQPPARHEHGDQHNGPFAQNVHRIRNGQPFRDASGAFATYSVNGHIDSRSAFFQSLGTNGRSCATCHAPENAFTITPPDIRKRFDRTHGQDPLFTPLDGANCPDARRSDRAAHSLLLERGLIRVAEAIPEDAEFTISVVHDPYGCALVSDAKSGQLVVSVYRRPLPSTNLAFLSTVMWDGRETVAALDDGATFLAHLNTDLAHQALDATTGHAQGQPPTDAQLTDIVNFERGLYTAQIWDEEAGRLDGWGTQGGPWKLSRQEYYPGINDPLGGEPTGKPFDPLAMTVFTAWAGNASTADADDMPSELRALGLRALAKHVRDRVAARRDIAEGERIFNTAPLTIATVRGLNDNAALGTPETIQGTCSTCHDAPNVGNHSLPLPVDIGVAHSAIGDLENDPTIVAALDEVDTPDLPVFEISGCPNPFKSGQPVSFYTTDPGRALVTGRCSDLNRVKGPILRALAARAPYFHDGAAATLMQVVNFYNERFRMGLTDRQKAQLVAFLNAL